MYMTWGETWSRCYVHALIRPETIVGIGIFN
jgi:hypothetical protein